MKLRLTHPARDDIAAVLGRSGEVFGDEPRRRYAQLIARAPSTLTSDRSPIGSRAADDIAPGVRILHLRHLPRARGRDVVARPRHMIVYRVSTGEFVVVLRVLHDAMDLAAHIERERSDNEQA